MDTQTLHVVHLAFLSLYAMLVLINSRLHFGMPGVRWFAIFYFCLLLGAALVGLRGWLPGLISITVGSWFGVIAYLALYFCIADYFGKKIIGLSARVAFCIITLLLFLQCGVIHPVTSLRLETNSTLLAIAQYSIAIYIHRNAKGSLCPSCDLMTLMLLGLGLNNCVQVVAVVLKGASSYQFGAEDLIPWTTLLNSAGQGGMMVAFFWLTSASLRRDLEVQASTDSLTGLLNRRTLAIAAQDLITQATRTSSPLSGIVLDIDNFKGLNDSLGHQFGDVILVAVANCLRNGLRKTDVVGRLGGDEFAILLPKTDLNSAFENAERLRHSLEALEIEYRSIRARTNASFGVAQMEGVEVWDELLFRCDKALYEGKKAGGNSVKAKLASESKSQHNQRIASHRDSITALLLRYGEVDIFAAA